MTQERPTPETDAFFRTFSDGQAAPSHAEYYDRMGKLELERNVWKHEAEMLRAELKKADEALEANIATFIDLRKERDEARNSLPNTPTQQTK